MIYNRIAIIRNGKFLRWVDREIFLPVLLLTFFLLFIDCLQFHDRPSTKQLLEGKVLQYFTY
jgi:hypothetical protein